MRRERVMKQPRPRLKLTHPIPVLREAMAAWERRQDEFERKQKAWKLEVDIGYDARKQAQAERERRQRKARNSLAYRVRRRAAAPRPASPASRIALVSTVGSAFQREIAERRAALVNWLETPGLGHAKSRYAKEIDEIMITWEIYQIDSAQGRPPNPTAVARVLAARLGRPVNRQRASRLLDRLEHLERIGPWPKVASGDAASGAGTLTSTESSLFGLF